MSTVLRDVSDSLSAPFLRQPTTDPVCAIALSSTHLVRPFVRALPLFAGVALSGAAQLVGRASGRMHRYALGVLALEGTFDLRCRPAQLSINCDASRCVARRRRLLCRRAGCGSDPPPLLGGAARV